MKLDAILIQCKHHYLFYEEQEEQILNIIAQVRTHLKEDQLKSKLLQKMPSS